MTEGQLSQQEREESLTAGPGSLSVPYLTTAGIISTSPVAHTYLFDVIHTDKNPLTSIIQDSELFC